MWTCCKQAQDQKFKLPRYQAERFHEIASECASQFNVSRRSGCFFSKNTPFSTLKMDELIIAISKRNYHTELASLSDWNREEISAGSSKTRAEKHGGSLSKDWSWLLRISFWPHRYSKSTTPKATQIFLWIKNCKNEIKNWFFLVAKHLEQ